MFDAIAIGVACTLSTERKVSGRVRAAAALTISGTVQFPGSDAALKSRSCQLCGSEFVPTGARQTTCDACSAAAAETARGMARDERIERDSDPE